MTATDYTMKPEIAEQLAGAGLLPRDIRIIAAQRLLAPFSNIGDLERTMVAELIADLIGMANSVVENCQTMLKDEAVARGWMHPYSVDRINFPSMNGALMGVSLAAGVDPEKLCKGCAFRLGSIANQCAPTQYDAKDAVEGEFSFFCHEDLDSKGKPTHGCLGFAQARRP